MKKILVFLLLYPAVMLQAQSIMQPEDMMRYRIQLDNRTNRHLHEVPGVILEGFCKGLFTAYYPKAAFNTVNFSDFLNHFRWNEPLINEGLLCGEDYCSNASFSGLFSKFNVYLDYFTYRHLNPLTSVIDRKVAFIQPVYTITINGIEYNFSGPLFRMDEVGNSIRIPNAENNSATQTLKQVFDLARFYSVQVVPDDYWQKDKRQHNPDDFREH